MSRDSSNDPCQGDAVWIMASVFIIFTMQSGFGLLESGAITVKNQANVIMKNVVDVLIGGLAYWLFGYGLSYGDSMHGIFGTSRYLFEGNSNEDLYSKDSFGYYFFRTSFAATSITIVSGAVAERVRFTSYMAFTFFNAGLIYAVPNHWIWDGSGFLRNMDAFDFAGGGAVHVVGGTAALIAALTIGPRVDRWVQPHRYTMSSPANSMLGIFFLWWGWIGFNCGSVYGIGGDKWALALKSGVTTMRAAAGGGLATLLLTLVIHRGVVLVPWLTNGILGGLVSVTAFCPFVSPWEATAVGAVGGLIAIGSDMLLRRLKVDDPVGAVGAHAGAGMWGLVAMGIFGKKDTSDQELLAKNGLLHGGDGSLLAVQLLYIACLLAWTSISTFVVVKVLDVTIGMRCDLVQEVFGADLMEHNIEGFFNHKTREICLHNGDVVSYIPEGASHDELTSILLKFYDAQGESEMNEMAASEDTRSSVPTQPKVCNISKGGLSEEVGKVMKRMKPTKETKNNRGSVICQSTQL